MFGWIRLIILAIVFLATLPLVCKKCKPKNLKKVRVLWFIVCVLVCTVFQFIPFENLFITFDSAEEAFEYYNPNATGELLQIEGKNSTFVQKTQDITNAIQIVPKTESGWTVPIGSYTKLVYNHIFEDFSVRVYQFKDTSDYYMCVLANKEKVPSLTDANGTVFIEKQRQVAPYDDSDVKYYAYVPEFKENYTLLVDDEPVLLSEGNGIGITVNRLK